MTTENYTIDILLVEDNPGDVRLAREALQETGVPTNLLVAEDGQQAITLLKSLDARSQPQLIILDLNLPRKDGREVLTEIKSDPHLRHIPVVVLTTSRADQDVRNAYDLHAKLTRAAKDRKAPKSEIIRDALESYFANGKKNPRLSCLDLAGDLVGSVDGPVDLATNPKYMEGFGQ